MEQRKETREKGRGKDMQNSGVASSHSQQNAEEENTKKKMGQKERREQPGKGIRGRKKRTRQRTQRVVTARAADEMRTNTGE